MACAGLGELGDMLVKLEQLADLPIEHRDELDVVYLLLLRQAEPLQDESARLLPRLLAELL